MPIDGTPSVCAICGILRSKKMTHIRSAWITAQAVSTSFIDDSLEQQSRALLDLLAMTGQVANKEQVYLDVCERMRHSSPQLEADIIVSHAMTEGVSDFCAAVGIVPHKKIYMLIAWNRATPHNLKHLGALVELLEDTDVKACMLEAQSPEDVLLVLDEHLKHFGIRI